MCERFPHYYSCVLVMGFVLACAAVPALPQTTLIPPAPVDGTPATPAGVATTAAEAGPTTTSAGSGPTTIVLNPGDVEGFLQTLLGLLPQLGGQPTAPQATPGTTGDPTGTTTFTPGKKEQPLEGFPYLMIKSRKLIRCGPGLAASMKYIQAGDQPGAVKVLQDIVVQMEAARAQNAKLQEGKQAAATRNALKIGLASMPAAGPSQPSTGAVTGTGTVIGTVTTSAASQAPVSTGPAAPTIVTTGKPPPDVTVILPPSVTVTVTLGPMAPCPPKGTVDVNFVIAVTLAMKQSSPIILDLNGNGIADVTTPGYRGDSGAFVARGSVRFDVSGRGERRRTEWLQAGKDGLLFLDANGNGLVDSATELFGDADGFDDGYSKLALLDVTHDGKLTGRELSGLAVWVDDGNGVCEPGEVRPLSSLDITEVSVIQQDYTSSFVRNGRPYASWDWFPRSE